MGGEHEITKVHVIFNLFSFSHYQYRLSGLCCYVARGTKKRMVGMSKLDTIKLYEDSEYIRLFGDDDTPEEVMEGVYKKELGSSFVKVESGVVIGKTEEKEERLPPSPPMSPFGD